LIAGRVLDFQFHNPAVAECASEVRFESNCLAEIGTSAQAVRKVVAVANELGREIATPAEARAIMGVKLGSQNSVASKQVLKPAM